jgi:hypothetical protein
MLVDENGLRAHQLRTSRPALAARAAAIAGDVLICQERRTSFSVDELRGFTQEEAARLRSRLSSDRTGARLTRRGTGEGLDGVDKHRQRKHAGSGGGRIVG